MAGTIGALASWLATAFVTLDQRAAQDRLEGRQLAHDSLTASSQGGGRLVFLHLFRTTYITGLILPEENTFFNLFVWEWSVAPVARPTRKASQHSGDYSMSGTVPASGIPIKAWFYPGDNAGVEFRVAPQLAAVAQPAPVVEAPPAATAEPTEAVPAVNPPPAETSSEAAPPAEPPAPQAQTETAPATSPEQSQKTDPAPEELPKTASPMPLIGLVGLVSIGLGVSLRMLTKRTA